MDTNTTNSFRLTQFSHGAGCGCKIAPAVLDSMLKSNIAVTADPRLLVGNDKKDDAAVYDLGNGKAVISTTDFFMPIVDDAFDFGRIASVNAISDIYAMGGKPLMAIAILGWPVNKIPAEIAAQVLEGSRSVCRDAGIMLAGGHSIDNPEPLFGLAVTGEVEIKHLKKNATASPGALLYLTKPLGVGIITTAQKKGIVSAADLDTAIRSMLTLNSLGEQLGKRSDVLALTDVTGFGLLGHLQEMCEGSGYGAVIRYSDVPRLGCIDGYIAQQAVPGGTKRNWDSYGHHISGCTEAMKNVLCDPQTSGGLLIAVAHESQAEFETWLESEGHFLRPFGKIIQDTAGKISVQD